MRTHHLPIVLAAAMLAACGSDPEPQPGGPTTVALDGTAAKGLLADADVAVLPVNADGSIGSSALASGTTGADGRYSLSFAATAGQPYVVRITAKAGTTHLDEVSGAPQPLPAGFTMRALLVPAGSGTTTATAHVTPFSELAVAAAARAAGGITAANAAQAASTVRQLLGFDPTAVAIKGPTDAASADEQKFAVLRAAVSQLAADGALGCGAGSAGDKTRCIVEALGSAARIDSLKLASGSGATAQDVSAVLSGAVGKVLTDDRLAGNVSSTVMAGVVANLGCSTDCTPGSSGGTGGVATAIAAARLMFDEIRTDWSTMFRKGGTGSAPGAFNQEVAAFTNAMNAVQAPLEMAAKDVAALLQAADFYNDYQAGRTASTSRGAAEGEFDDDGKPYPGVDAVACTLYTDTTTTVVATTPAEAKVIGCRALYFIARAFPTPGTTVTTEWRHGFTIEARADGSFDYSTRARRRETTCTPTGCTLTANVALQTDAGGVALPAFTGKLTPVTSGAFGPMQSFKLLGELPAAFVDGGRTLANFKHTVDLSGTRTTASDGSEATSITGTLVAYRDATTAEGTLTLKAGSLKQWPAAGAALQPGELDFDIVWRTGGSEFEGRIALTDSIAASGQRLPTKAVLDGAARNIAAGTTTEFARGTVTAETTGLAAFNPAQPLGPSNTFKVRLTLLAAVSAAGRPTLEISLGTEADAYAAQSGGTLQAQLQYRTLVGGKPRQVVTLDAQGSANGVPSFTLKEAVADLSATWSGEPATVDLMQGTTKVGTVDTRNGLLTFVDGSFVSLDFGL